MLNYPLSLAFLSLDFLYTGTSKSLHKWLYRRIFRAIWAIHPVLSLEAILYPLAIQFTPLCNRAKPPSMESIAIGYSVVSKIRQDR